MPLLTNPYGMLRRRSPSVVSTLDNNGRPFPSEMPFDSNEFVPSMMGEPLLGEGGGSTGGPPQQTRRRGRTGGIRGGGRVGGHGAGGTPVRWLTANMYEGNDGRIYTIDAEGPGGRSVSAQPGNLQGSRLPGGLSRGKEIRMSMLRAAGGGAPRPGMGGVGGGSGLDQLGRVFRDETGRMQEAADEQHGRNLAQERAMEEMLRGINPSLVGTADANAGLMREEAGRVGVIGDQAVAAFDRQSGDIMGNLDRDLKGVLGAADEQMGAADEALGFARRAEAAGMSAVSGYDVASHENIANTVAGLEKRFQSSAQMVANGLNPDGTRMTPEEQQASRRELQFETSQAVGQTVAGLRDQQQQFHANLKTALANIRLGGGQIALGAAGQKGEAGRLKLGAAETGAGTAAGQQAGRLEAEKVRMGFRELSASLLNMGANLQNEARAVALQLEMSGRTALAEMVRNNPRSIISMFAGLLTLQEVGSAPGGRNLPAIPGF